MPLARGAGGEGDAVIQNLSKGSKTGGSRLANTERSFANVDPETLGDEVGTILASPTRRLG